MNKALESNKENGFNVEIEKSKVYLTVEIIEYLPNSVVSKTIIKRSTGNITVMSFDNGEGLTEKTTPFDTFAQIIEGNAEIVIAGQAFYLELSLMADSRWY